MSFYVFVTFNPVPSFAVGCSSTNFSKATKCEDAPSLKDLRDSVYAIMESVNKIPFCHPSYFPMQYVQ